MQPKQIKITIIILSLLVFGFSLSQDAFITSHFSYGKIETTIRDSLEVFLMGMTAFLGGGFWEFMIWTANPLSLIAIIMLWKDKKEAQKLALIALGIALSFSFWNEVLANEGGGKAKIVSLELGYYLWLLSMIILNIGIYFYFSVFDVEKENRNGKK